MSDRPMNAAKRTAKRNRRPKKQRKLATKEQVEITAKSHINTTIQTLESEPGTFVNLRDFYTKRDSIETEVKGKFGKVIKMYNMQVNIEKAFTAKIWEKSQIDKFRREKAAF